MGGERGRQGGRKGGGEGEGHTDARAAVEASGAAPCLERAVLRFKSLARAGHRSDRLAHPGSLVRAAEGLVRQHRDAAPAGNVVGGARDGGCLVGSLDRALVQQGLQGSGLLAVDARDEGGGGAAVRARTAAGGQKGGGGADPRGGDRVPETQGNAGCAASGSQHRPASSQPPQSRCCHLPPATSVMWLHPPAVQSVLCKQGAPHARARRRQHHEGDEALQGKGCGRAGRGGGGGHNPSGGPWRGMRAWRGMQRCMAGTAPPSRALPSLQSIHLLTQFRIPSSMCRRQLTSGWEPGTAAVEGRGGGAGVVGRGSSAGRRRLALRRPR